MLLIVTHKERLIVKRIYLICLYLIIFLFVNLVKYQYEYVMLHVHYNNKLNIQNIDFLVCYSIEILYKVTPSRILPSIYLRR